MLRGRGSSIVRLRADTGRQRHRDAQKDVNGRQIYLRPRSRSSGSSRYNGTKRPQQRDGIIAAGAALPCRPGGRAGGRAVNNSACSGGELRRRYNKNKRVVPVVISRRAASVDQLMRFTIAVIYLTQLSSPSPHTHTDSTTLCTP